MKDLIRYLVLGFMPVPTTASTSHGAGRGPRGPRRRGRWLRAVAASAASSTAAGRHGTQFTGIVVHGHFPH